MKSTWRFLSSVRQESCEYGQAPFRNRLPRPVTRRTFSNGYSLGQKSRVKAPIRGSAPPQKPVKVEETPTSYAESLLQDSSQVLLYASPNHRSLYFSAYLVGGAFLFGGYSWAQFALKEPPGKDGEPATEHRKPWYLKAVLAAEILVTVALGTHFILTPTKLVKSITLVKAAVPSSTASTVEPTFRLEIKRALPFLKADVVEAAASKIFIDRKLVTANPRLSYFDVPRADAQEFTSKYSSGTYEVPSIREGSVLGSIWPSIKRETRRMFIRDQMASIRTIDNGRFKLDMQGAALLDGSVPIKRLISPDQEQRIGILSWVRGVMST